MIEKLYIPNIGSADPVDVIEVAVSAGQTIAVDDPLLTLEGDKATMEVPAKVAGTIVEVMIAVGDQVTEGDLILSISVAADTDVSARASAAPSAEVPAVTDTKTAPATTKSPAPVAPEDSVPESELHAGPAVRRIAREFGIRLSDVPATGPKGRVLKSDIQAYVKARLAGGAAPGQSIIPQAPAIDFSQFGAIETQPLSKIKRLTGQNLSRNWVSIPHVTHFDQTDITEMEAFRQAKKGEAAEQGIRLTPLVFMMKALTRTLARYPQFNTSLSPDGQSLIYKSYYHIGVAVETPKGLVVPVIRDVDKKGFFQLAKELAEISQKARSTGLAMADMQGGSMTISSLGGIGGTGFTPIVNAPEVAILGVSKSSMQPVYEKNTAQFVPRLILPMSLSYDHRVIDGAEAARFMAHLSACISDIRDLLL